MSILSLLPELPLLKRELIELSNRRRTYVVRFLGAIVILTIVMIRFFEQMDSLVQAQSSAMQNGWGGGPSRFYGSGGHVFNSIVPMLFQSIQLLMPALICGAITIEKERNTLGTLFVTRLTPMTIILEKLGSRIIPMLTFLLLSFPLLAFVYSLGGVDTSMLLGTIWLLLCECLFYASIGLVCSSWFATTASAFIASYILTGMVLIASTALRLDFFYPVISPYSVWKFAFFSMDYGSSYGRSPGIFRSFMMEVLGPAATNNDAVLLLRLGVVFFASIPSMMVAVFFVIMARVFLIRRAFVSSSSVLLRVFKSVDKFFTKLNDRTTGGVVLVRDYDSLPAFDPVAWRERSKKSLGKARYLFRILVVMEGPVLFICLGAATASNSTNFSGLRGLLGFVWVVAAMILAMKSSTMISSERTRETLEALLSTPLTSREILQQKIAGMRRLMMVLAIPILSVHLTLMMMNFDVRSLIQTASFSNLGAVLWYGVLVTATTTVTMHMIVWLSALVGLRSATQGRSVMAALATLGGWMVISMWVMSPGGLGYQLVNGLCGGDVYVEMRGYDSSSSQTESDRPGDFVASLIGCLVRPDGSIQANETILVAATNSRLNESSMFYWLSRTPTAAFFASLIVFLFHCSLMFLIRRFTLRMAPRLLKRRDEVTTDSASPAMASLSFSPATENV